MTIVHASKQGMVVWMQHRRIRRAPNLDLPLLLQQPELHREPVTRRQHVYVSVTRCERCLLASGGGERERMRGRQFAARLLVVLGWECEGNN